jgi:N-acetylglutamate synthase-like GNAT family acetyltransferase
LIRPYQPGDFQSVLFLINESAQAYKGIIPEDRWHDPYMSREYLENEIGQGVRFSIYEENGTILGVMGIQDVQDVTLIRHAYVLTNQRDKGIGSSLIHHLMGHSSRPILVGTWAAAQWAVHFYEKHGFCMVSSEMKGRLLRKYWSIPERQVETSVVLADSRGLQLEA